MKTTPFVTLSSCFFLGWLSLSYVTALKPQPLLGKGSKPIALQSKKAQPLVGTAAVVSETEVADLEIVVSE